jgi:hypothetical protein
MLALVGGNGLQRQYTNNMHALRMHGIHGATDEHIPSWPWNTTVPFIVVSCRPTFKVNIAAACLSLVNDDTCVH